MPAVGIPFALLLGALAELIAGVNRAGFRRAMLEPFAAFWGDLRRTLDRRDRVTLLESLGAGAALVGAGLVGAAALGTGPGGLPLLYLSLGLAVGGAHLVALEATTRPAGARARARLLEALLIEPVAAVALAVVFLRWRATDLGQVWGVHEVLGTGFEVGPASAAVGGVLAVLVLLLAAPLRLPAGPEPRRGRTGRPGGGGVLLRLSRWAVAGATASLAPALLAGLEIRRAELGLDLLIWAGTALGATVVLGAAWAWASRLSGRFRLALIVPSLAVVVAGAVVLVEMA